MMSRWKLPEPLNFGWQMKPLDSAQTRMHFLPDGRMECTIEHDIIKGVSPDMLYWWFTHIGGDMNYNGQTYPRYRVWHPHDHIYWSLAKPGPNGKAEVGSVFHIVEAFGRSMKYLVEIRDVVEKLDPTGIRLSTRRAAIEVATLEHTFTPTPIGTIYRSRLLVGSDHPVLAFPLNNLVRPQLFSEAMGQAWMKHNVEEVGNFEFFLPALYEAQASVTTRNATPSISAINFP